VIETRSARTVVHKKAATTGKEIGLVMARRWQLHVKPWLCRLTGQYATRRPLERPRHGGCGREKAPAPEKISGAGVQLDWVD
jgi:hypothetical protein